MDLTTYFEAYEALVRKADAAFEQVKEAFPECVRCHRECADCCHALFDLSLIEALYINHHFQQTFRGGAREALLEKANRVDRQLARIKREAAKALEAGKNEADVLEDLASTRVRCPLLNDDNLCDLYPYRPVTCRLYGIPTAIGGRGYTCGLSGFEPGKSYPTVHLDLIQAKLQEISASLLRDIRSRHIKLADLLVPLSMALLTAYDDAYLGVDEVENPQEEKRDG
ncbi:MAG: YkgJ family cysteine cluster protein [Desulfobacteraceae bacterium]|jgi:Fe-S-cluster containining protein|nr:YkgJ family cysteine cluster protein [Desulfobacteraceae bacterium]